MRRDRRGQGRHFRAAAACAARALLPLPVRFFLQHHPHTRAAEQHQTHVRAPPVWAQPGGEGMLLMQVKELQLTNAQLQQQVQQQARAALAARTTGGGGLGGAGSLAVVQQLQQQQAAAEAESEKKGAGNAVALLLVVPMQQQISHAGLNSHGATWWCEGLAGHNTHCASCCMLAAADAELASAHVALDFAAKEKAALQTILQGKVLPLADELSRGLSDLLSDGDGGDGDASSGSAQLSAQVSMLQRLLAATVAAMARASSGNSGVTA